MLYELQDWFDDLRDRHGALLKAVMLLAGLVFFVLAFAFFPRTQFGDAVGLTSAQIRLRAVGSAIYWSVKARVDNEESTTPQVLYGMLNRLDEKANKLVVDLPLDDKWVTREMVIADLIITDPEAGNAYFEQLATRNARLEVYYGTHVVAFVRDQPLNIGLIEAGAAAVNPRPPSNMVTKAYASYYWSVVKGITPSTEDTSK